MGREERYPQYDTNRSYSINSQENHKQGADHPMFVLSHSINQLKTKIGKNALYTPWTYWGSNRKSRKKGPGRCPRKDIREITLPLSLGANDIYTSVTRTF